VIIKPSDFFITMSDSDLGYEDLAQLVSAAASVISFATLGASLCVSERQESEPYHTSALTGIAWVYELINGHPMRIYTELGVRLPVFISLVIALRSMGCMDSRNGVNNLPSFCICVSLD
jgi:hypothetical protein